MSVLLVWVIAFLLGAVAFFVSKKMLDNTKLKEKIGPWTFLISGLIALAVTVIVGVILDAVFKPGDVVEGTTQNASEARDREAWLVANYGGRVSPKSLEVAKVFANRPDMTIPVLQDFMEDLAGGGWVIQDHVVDGVPLAYAPGLLNWTHAYHWSAGRASMYWHGLTTATKDDPYKKRIYITKDGLTKADFIDPIKSGYTATWAYYDPSRKENVKDIIFNKVKSLTSKVPLYTYMKDTDLGLDCTVVPPNQGSGPGFRGFVNGKVNAPQT